MKVNRVACLDLHKMKDCADESCFACKGKWLEGGLSETSGMIKGALANRWSLPFYLAPQHYRNQQPLAELKGQQVVNQ